MRFVRKSPASMLVSAGWYLQNYGRELQNHLRFGLTSWHPRGASPVCMAYYPDALRILPDLGPLYTRWIRGNKINNNGDAMRFMALILNLRQLQADGIAGDFAELGVWKGNSAAILADFAAKSGRRLFLFDTFSGFDQRDLKEVDAAHAVRFADTSVGYVQKTVGHLRSPPAFRGSFPSL